jgi:long-chain acyl-CoA synthetase
MKTKINIDKINWGDIIKEKVNTKLPKSDITSWILLNISKIFFKIYFKIRVKGQENIPNTPCIFAPNHQSYFDGLFAASAFNRNILKRTFFYTKANHIKSKWLKKFTERNNIIVVDVQQDLKQSIQTLAEALKKGKNVVIFPEGTRSKTGELGEFKKTFAILSKELNVPVAPIAIDGAFDVLPKGKHFPKPFKKITITYLPPIKPLGQTYFTITEETREAIKSKLAKQHHN